MCAVSVSHLCPCHVAILQVVEHKEEEQGPTDGARKCRRGN